jgi:hypothetical protein
VADTVLGDVAVWASHAPSYEETLSAPAPVYLRPAIRPQLATAAGRAILAPVAAAVAVRRGTQPQDLLGFQLWQETARSLGIKTVLRLDGSPSPLTACLPRLRPTAEVVAPAVGLAMIAQDEERRIGAALASVVDWVEDIVVVDGGSHDGTREIAASFGARVIDRPFDGDFAQQRNAGLSTVRTPWVLVLDADETLSPELPAILDHISGAGHVDGVSVHFLNLLDSERAPWYWPDRKLRFFRSGRLMTGRIHEGILGLRRLAYLPVSGPFILHQKSLTKQWDREKQYFDIDPSYYSAEDAERIRRWRSEGGTEEPGGH